MPARQSAEGAQAEVLAFLGDPASHGAGTGQVERIDTHAAVIFLAGALRFGELGALEAVEGVVEWAVRMRRFSQDTLFDRMARAGQLSEALCRRLAEAVAAFHEAAAVLCDDRQAGGRAGIAGVFAGNRCRRHRGGGSVPE